VGLRIAVVVLLALVGAAPASPARGAVLKVTLTAPGHAPAIGKRWTYTVQASRGGKPAAARITVQIVDPIGGVHPVDFGTTKKPIVNRPFTGVFRDFVLWTGDSRGIPLRLRVTVSSGGAKKVVDYRVTPRS
jgi:hypothetical protein